MTNDIGKRLAAEAAVLLVEDGMRLGLGTGSTMQFALDALAQRCRAENLSVTCVATSARTEHEADRLGLKISSLAEITELDLAIDGADEVVPESLALIKGLGGALLREKIVAINSRRFVVAADASKLVSRLGKRASVPVEVVTFGHEATARRLKARDATPILRCDGGGAPFLTDGGNLIYDCQFASIDDPAALHRDIKTITGVVETGLFLKLAQDAFIAADNGTVRHLRVSDT